MFHSSLSPLDNIQPPNKWGENCSRDNKTTFTRSTSMFINLQTISCFGMVQLQSLWSMITGWIARWKHTKERFCACPGGTIMYFNAQQRWGCALSILVLWETWGVGPPPLCPITLCQKGCGHANLFLSGPWGHCLVIKTLSAPPISGHSSLQAEPPWRGEPCRHILESNNASVSCLGTLRA